MSSVNLEKIKLLQNNQKNIRNVCILAHVDHGKTTLADALIANNGIISSRMAGKLRYLDSREDEQIRGITMKSSAISLHFQLNLEEYLINLIDSPGHIDFGGEVSAAVRLCDGAIIIVDVVEGVCPQTYGALKQAWLENLKPVLVLNKIDRLIVELRMSTEEAEKHLGQILEQVNAIMGELFTTDVLAKYAQEFAKQQKDETKIENTLDYTSLLDDKDDSLLYFSTDHGNVVFASAIDGWGFRIEQFTSIYSKKVGINEKILNKTLWGDYYLNSKTKCVKKGAKRNGKKTLFVQLILDNIWKMYDSILNQKNKELTEKIISSLNLPLKIRGNDWRGILYNVFNTWIPLAQAVLEMVCLKCPNPTEMPEERAVNFFKSKDSNFEMLPKETASLIANLRCSNSDKDAPLIIFISKMFQFDPKFLPKHRPKPLTLEQIAEKRENIKNKLLLKENTIIDKTTKLEIDNSRVTDNDTESLDQPAFIAFGRVFSGRIKKGQQLFILGPKHRPQSLYNVSQLEYITNSTNIHQFIVSDLYLLMGKELEELDEVSSGNILGIGCLDKFILKTATISSTIFAPTFSDLFDNSLPIVRVAVQPRFACDMGSLIEGLKLLSQSDPTIEVVSEDNGEHLLVAAGEIHLQKCLDDLTNLFAKIQIDISTPTVPFRETIVPAPTRDQVNESISERQTNSKSDASFEVEHVSVDGLVTISIEALPIPDEIYKLFDSNRDLIKLLIKGNQDLRSAAASDASKISLHSLVSNLKILEERFTSVFNDAGKPWNNFLNNIWSFGPKRNWTNMLVNGIEEYKRGSLWDEFGTSSLEHWDSSIISGFQLAVASGPMCEETMTRVCFIVRKCELNAEDVQNGTEEYKSKIGMRQSGHFIKGLVISTMKECCRRAFQVHSQRLVWPMYSCVVQTSVEVIGRAYSVINKRFGRVLEEDQQEGSTTFTITSLIPIIESFGFAEEFRKKTSGFAIPQLKFSHWEILDMDPYWVPTTEEEYLHFGEKADSENPARKYLNNIRRRKGLKVDEKIVEFAEKQRTLTRNK